MLNGKVKIPLELKEIIDSGIDSATNTLYYDLKDKAMYFIELSMITDSFSPFENFKLIISRLSNQLF